MADSPKATTTALKAKVQTVGEARPGFDVREAVKAMQPQFAKALAKMIDPERFVRIALTEFSKKPKLLACAPETIYGALLTAAQMGLEFGPLGHAYLVPYNRWTKRNKVEIPECQLQIGYKGLIDLARRSGTIKDIKAQEVYEGDRFRYWRDEVGDHLIYEPWASLPPRERVGPQGEIWCYFGHAVYTNGGSHVRVMSLEEIEERRNRNPGARADDSPWKRDPIPMSRKTVIRAMQAYLPLTVEVQERLSLDEGIIRGRTDGSVIDVSYAEAPPLAALPSVPAEDTVDNGNNTPCCDKHAALGENDGSPCAWDAAQDEPVPITDEAAIQAELPPEKLEQVIARVRSMNLKQVDFFLSEYEITVDDKANADTRRKRLAEYLAQKEAENLGAEES